MDRLAEHEAFLRAIFDAPDDDTPRLVYADFLEENGEPERASRIRTLGFDPPWKTIAVPIDSLQDPIAFRWSLVRNSPEVFAVEGVRPSEGLMTSTEQFDALFQIPAFTRVTELDLGGEVEETIGGEQTEDAGTYALIDMNVEPVITVEGVEALASHRGARRIQSLILTNNNLDNDAARALVRSPYLINLKRLDLLEGNRLRGRTWQQLLEKFGEDVVG